MMTYFVDTLFLSLHIIVNNSFFITHVRYVAFEQKIAGGSTEYHILFVKSWGTWAYEKSKIYLIEYLKKILKELNINS